MPLTKLTIVQNVPGNFLAARALGEPDVVLHDML